MRPPGIGNDQISLKTIGILFLNNVYSCSLRDGTSIGMKVISPVGGPDSPETENDQKY